MKAEAFRAFMAPRLSTRGVSSYLSNIRRVERLLDVDIDRVVLDEAAIGAIGDRLRRAGVPDAPARDCCTALRRYGTFQAGGGLDAPDLPCDTPSPGRPNHVARASIRQLLRLHCHIGDELRERGISRTGNGPLGDYAEHLFARAFDWSLEGNSTSGHDAVDADGRRYQIKARRLTKRSPSRQLGAIRQLSDHRFDSLAAVLFDEGMDVKRAALIPHEIVVELAKRSEHTNSWRFMLTDRVWNIPGVEDVTSRLNAVISVHEGDA